MTYELIHTEDGDVLKATDEAGVVYMIPCDPANRHYAEYLATLEEEPS